MISIFIVAMLFLFTFSVWGGEFLETFDDGDLKSWQELVQHNAAPGSWKVINGELHAISPGEATRLLTIGDEAWRDYIVEFDVRPLKKHGPGNIAIAARIHGTWLMSWMVGDLPFLGLKSRVTGAAGNFHENKSIFFHVEPSPFLRLNKWSTLKLRVYEDVLTLWINGKQVFKTPDVLIPWGKVFQIIDPGFPGFLTGGVGFGLTNYTARFDNITITGNGIPDRGALSVTPRAKLASTWGSLKNFIE